MKAKKLSVYGFASMLLIGAASCSNDDLSLDGPKPLEVDKSFYLNISVNGNNPGTRADEVPGGGGALGDYTDAYDPEKNPNYDQGTTDENNVKNVYLVFYDANGVRLSSENPLIKDLKPSSGSNNSENQIFSGVVQVDVKRGENIPAYVLCFVNPSTTDFMNNDNFKTLAAVEQSYTKNFINSESFAMSNSVYYGYDAVTQANQVRIMATPIANTMLFDTEKKAQDALEGKPADSTVDIYVERYAGKVDFNLANDAVKPLNATTIDGTPVVLKFIPEFWAVNATEDNSYITKNYFAQNSTGGFDFSKPSDYTTVNNALNWYWNSEDLHRSYWGQSPAYYKANYPRVADDIMDEEGWVPTSKGSVYTLKYYSYNELDKDVTDNGDKLTALARTVGNTTPIYTRENTVSGNALGKAALDPTASPLAAIASAIMVGHYEVTVDGTKETPDIFYVTVNNSGATPEYTYYTTDDMIKTFLLNTIPLGFSTDNGNTVTPLTAENLASYKNCLIVEHPSKDVRGGIVMDSRTVTLQLTDAAKGVLYAKIGDDYQQVNASNFVNINQNVMSSAGTAYGFSGGKCYYSIPVQHLGYYRTDNANKNVSGGANNAEFKWYDSNEDILVKSGDFGIVRNHSYKINVSLVTGLGNGIPYPDDPIVPPTNPEEYYIGAKIVVLNWAIVPTQNVELK